MLAHVTGVLSDGTAIAADSQAVVLKVTGPKSACR